MSITGIITAMQTRHAAISGVTTAPTTFPASIAPSELPLLLTDLVTFEEHQEAHGEDEPATDYVFRVRGFCQSAQLGTVDQGKQAIHTLLDAVLADYRGDAGLNSTAFFRTDVPGGVRGRVVNDLAYGAESYFGFEILVQIQERPG